MSPRRAVDDFDETCELCGAPGTDEAPLVICEGALVCGGCANQHGGELAQYHDATDEELRG